MTSPEKNSASPDIERLALAAELTGVIPLDDPASFVGVAQTIVADPGLREAWGVDDDIYDAVDALCAIIDRAWPGRRVPWHLERFVLWQGGAYGTEAQSMLRATGRVVRKSVDAVMLNGIVRSEFGARAAEREAFDEVYPRGSREHAHAASLLLQHHPNDVYALEGLVLVGPVERVAPAMGSIAAHLRRHREERQVQDFLTRHLSYFAPARRSPTSDASEFYTAERALHVIDRLIETYEAHAAESPGALGLGLDSRFVPSARDALKALYTHLELDDQLRILERMAPALGDHPAARALAATCEPDILVERLLGSAAHAERLLDIADRAPGVRERASSVALRALSTLASAAPDAVRAVISREPLLLAPAFERFGASLEQHEHRALRSALEGATALIDPIAHSGLPLNGRLWLLALIGRPAALDATVALLHVYGSRPAASTHEESVRLNAALIDDLWWISPLHWLDLAVSWPRFLHPLANSARFVTWVRFHAESRARLYAADLGPDLTLARSIEDLVLADQPAPGEPPNEDGTVWWLRRHVALGTDVSLDIAVDAVQALIPAERFGLLGPILHRLPQTHILRFLLRIEGLEDGQHRDAPIKIAEGLSRDELAPALDERLVELIWRFAAGHSPPAQVHQSWDFWARLVPWAAAHSVDAGVDAVEATRWVVALLVRVHDVFANKSGLVSEGLLEFICHLKPDSRLDAVLAGEQMLEPMRSRSSTHVSYFHDYNEAVQTLWKPIRRWLAPIPSNRAVSRDDLGRRAPLMAQQIDAMCRRWCRSVETQSVAGDPTDAMRPEDRPPCLTGFLDHFETIVRDNRDHTAFTGRLLALMQDDTTHRDRLYDIVVTAWLRDGRIRWCSAVDGAHWNTELDPQSTVGRTIDAIWQSLAGADVPEQTHDSTDAPTHDLCLPWLAALSRGLGATPDADPVLVDGALHAMARLSPPGDSTLRMTLEGLAVAASSVPAAALDLHRRMALAIADGATPARSAGRRIREARRAMIRADRRARGFDDDPV